MSTLLPPTVNERLARCGQRVDVDGLAVGATVELDVDGAISTVVATGGGHTFTVPGLNAGAKVRARQDAGAGFTPYSPTVTVEDAFVPPEAPPSLPEVIGACSQCVLVTHATPGAGLELRIGSNLVGSGVADSDGSACVGVDLRAEKGKAGLVVLARQVLCGAGGPDAHRALAVQPPLPKPVIGDPIFGCQRRVPISGAQPGAKVAFETDGGADLGSACSCWQNVDVFVARALAVGESVRVRCLFDAKPCDSQGSWSAWRLVVAPDERITPEVLEALVEGDQLIRVANQIAGASLMVRIAATQGGVVEEFGPRPTSDHQEVALNAPLVAGNVVTVVQTLCGVSMESDPVVVQEPPPEVLAPVIVPPLYECGQVVRVSGLHPGAHVRVLMDGVPVGLTWAGLQTSVAVPAAPVLTAGRKVTAVQTVGTTASPPSDPVVVDMFAKLHTPRLLEPLGADDRAVRVSGVTPGAHVAVLSGGVVIGEVDAAEPVVRVPIDQPVGGLGEASARVRLCNRTVAGPAVQAVLSPCVPLLDTEVVEATVDLGDFDVPVVLDGGGFTFRVRGQLYAPGTRDGRMPLVVVAHGWHTGVSATGPVESFKGYEYLSSHLARCGMVVFSLDLQTINDRSFSEGNQLQQFARAEVILHTIAALQGLDAVADILDVTRVGLVGHSMGAEAVVLTQFVNLSEGRGAGIRGVVSIAPTRWHPTVVLPETRSLQIFGSLDQLTAFVQPNDAPSASGGMRIYDRAERTKSFFWAHGMRHNPFNSLWVAAGGFAEQHLADIALPEEEHRRLARCLINAFFQDALLNQQAYAGYMEGTILPQSLRHLEIHGSHSKQPRDVLDNFGDADAQSGVTAEVPLDRTVNTRGQTVQADGAGLGTWQDVNLVTVPNSPHSTAGVRLAWAHPRCGPSGGVKTMSGWRRTSSRVIARSRFLIG